MKRWKWREWQFQLAHSFELLVGTEFIQKNEKTSMARQTYLMVVYIITRCLKYQLFNSDCIPSISIFIIVKSHHNEGSCSS